MTEEQKFIVNTSNVSDSNCYYMNKNLANLIRKNSYINVGDFFEKMHDSDLDILVDKITQSKNEKLGPTQRLRRSADLMLFSCLLSLGEGKSLFDNSEVTELMERMTLLTFVTAMDREGKVRALYKNYNMTEREAPFFEEVT